MSKTYNIEGMKIELISDMFTENEEKGIKYYHGVCKCNNNTIHVTKNITGTSEHDVVDDIFHGIGDTPLKHLANVLQNESSILVMINKYKDEHSSYIIYYGYNENFDTVLDINKWAFRHNDYAEDKCPYTEVHNGHQKKIEFEE